jgi:hypothetical protein
MFKKLLFTCAFILPLSPLWAQYCIPTATDCSRESVLRRFITFGGLQDIDFSSPSCIGSGFNFADEDTLRVRRGDEIHFLLGSNNVIPYGYYIWIDWDQNGSYQDGGEFIFNSQDPSFNKPYPIIRQGDGSFTVPNNAPFGFTRIRVLVYQIGAPGIPGSCTFSTLGHPGQVRDFVVEVTSGGGCIISPTQATVKTLEHFRCAGDNVILYSNTGINPGNIYQWQSAASGGGPFVDIPDAVKPYYIANPTQTTFYRLKVTCGPHTSTTSSFQVHVRTSPLNGSYTINNLLSDSPTNFTSITKAARILRCVGMSGPVTITVNPNSGPYRGHIILQNIANPGNHQLLLEGSNLETRPYRGILYGISIFGPMMVIGNSQNIKVKDLKIIVPAQHITTTLSISNATDIILENCLFQTADSIRNNVAVTNSTNVLFSSSSFKGGNNGIFSSSSTNLTLENSVFNDQHAAGIDLGGAENTIIDSNEITATNRVMSKSYTAIKCESNGAEIRNNKIHNVTAGQANNLNDLKLISVTTEGTTPFRIYNNLMYNNIIRGEFTGIYVTGEGQNTYIAHNTLHSRRTSGFVSLKPWRGLHIDNYISGGLTVINNIFETDRQSTGTQFLYGNSGPGVLNIDHNIYYHPDFVESTMYFSDINGVKDITFEDWQQRAGLNGNEAGSRFLSPNYEDAGNANFTPKHPLLANSGSSISIPRDIYGTPRNAAPSIGAIEFSPPPGADPFIERLVLDSAVCSGLFPITAIFNNFGGITTDSLKIDLYLNGTFHQNYTVTTPIPTGTQTAIVLDQINITPSTSYDMEFIITEVFPGPDLDTTNNIYIINGVRSKMSGNYTVNQTAPASGTNFTSHAEVIHALNNYGICGPVIISTVAFSGPYTEVLHLKDIPGSSPVNTVTFLGNGNVLRPDANYGTHMAFWHLERTKYVEIDGFNFNLTNISFVQRENDALLLSNNARVIAIKNCSISMPVGTAVTSSTNLINVTGDKFIDGHLRLGDSLTIEGCTFTGGGIAVKVTGKAGDRASSLYIENNYFAKNQKAIFIQLQDDIHLLKNICNLAGNRFAEIEYVANLTIEQNRVYTDLNRPHIFVFTLNAYELLQITGDLKIINNTVSMLTSNANGFKINSNNADIHFYHNTILSYSPDCFNCFPMDLLSNGTSDIDIQNNIFVRFTGDQSAFYTFTGTFQNFTSDHNMYYSYHNSPSDVVMESGVTSANGFGDWQNMRGGSDEIYQNPVFFDFMAHDLTPTAKRISQKGNNILNPSVDTDIDDIFRKDPPDPGAIEFIPYPCPGILTKKAELSDSLVNVFWTTTEDSIDIAYGPTGFNPGSGGTTIFNLSGEDYTIDGLSGGDCIDIYLREQCHSGSQPTGSWEGPIEICVPHLIDLAIVNMPLHNPVCDNGAGTRLVPVVIRNAGLKPVTGFTLRYSSIGINFTNDSIVHTGTIPPGDSITLFIPFSGLEDGGRLTVSTTVRLNNDGDLTNNSMTVPYYIIPLEPKPMQLTLCENDPGPVKLYGNKYPGVAYVWYNSDTAIYRNFISDEDTLVITSTPPVGRTFYVEYFFYQFEYQNYSTLTFEDIFIHNPNLNIRSEEYDLNKGPEIDPSCPGLYTINHDPYKLVNNINQSFITESVNGGLINELFSQCKIPTYNIDQNVMPGGSQSIPGTYSRFFFTSVPYRFNPTGEIHTELHLGRIPDGTGCNAQFQRITPGNWESTVKYIYTGCSTVRVPITIETTPPPVAGFDFVENSMRGFFTSTAIDADSVYFEVITLGLGGKPGGYVTFDFPAVGNYLVCQYVYNACGADTICEWIEIKNTRIGIDEEELNQSISVFPNPSEGMLTIRGEKFVHSPTNITITDALGNIVEKRHWNAVIESSEEKTFDLRHLAAGIYLINIEQRNMRVVKKWAKL